MTAPPRILSDCGVFAPNQQVSLSELETEEREIESFKRFDYFFKPPVHKPKVNFDVKNIVLANRKNVPSPDSASSFFDVQNATAQGKSLHDHPLDDFFADMSMMSLRGNFNIDELGILDGSDAGQALRADTFIQGLLDGNDMKSGMVD